MPCTQTLSGIPRDCATSMGGIVEVYIANYDDVSGVTVTDDIIKTISMADTAKFKKYSFRKGTGSMTSTLNVDPTNGTNYVSTDLVLQFMKMDTSKRVEIAALAVGELVIIVKDANGKYWYLGKDNAVTASAGEGTTGTAATDANRYQITLQDNSQTYPMEVDAGALADIVD